MLQRHDGSNAKPKTTPDISKEIPPSIFESEQREYAGKFTVTGYCPCEICCGIWAENRPGGVVYTASGETAIAGVTCGSAEVWPFGAEFEIDGVGRRVVQDRGAVKQVEWIDLYFDTHEQAAAFGKQTLDVWVITKR